MRVLYVIHTCQLKGADDIDHMKERTWILSWSSGDQLWQLMMLNTRSFCGKLVQFLRHIATMSEDQVKCIHKSHVAMN